MGKRLRAHTGAAHAGSAHTGAGHTAHAARTGAAHTTGADDWSAAYTELVGERDYDPREFYTRASDHQGHSRSRTVRWQPEIDAQVIACVESAETPYKSVSDFIRDAVVHRLRMVAAMQDDTLCQQRIACFVAAEHLERIAAETERNQAIVSGAGNKLALLTQANDAAGLAAFCGHVATLAESMTQPYADQIRAVLNAAQLRLGYIRQMQAAHLTQSEARILAISEHGERK